MSTNSTYRLVCLAQSNGTPFYLIHGLTAVAMHSTFEPGNFCKDAEWLANGGYKDASPELVYHNEVENLYHCTEDGSSFYVGYSQEMDPIKIVAIYDTQDRGYQVGPTGGLAEPSNPDVRRYLGIE